jgi:hypothetical protein
MRAKKYLFLFAFVFLCGAGLPSNSFAWDFPLDIDIVAIQFDSTGCSTTYDICVNGTTELDKPEYVVGSSRNNRFACKINSAPTLWVNFYCNSAPDISTSLTIDALAVSGTTYWHLADKAVMFNGGGGSIADQGNPTNFVTFNTGGGTTVAESVGICDILWNWRVVAVGGTPISPINIANSSHEYYTVLDTPKAPMSEPWTEVLDYSCNWATENSYEAACVDSLTMKLFNCGVNYDPNGDGYTNLSDEFNLSMLLENISNPSEVQMCCVDFSHFFNILSASLGIQCYWEEITTSFTTREILRAGHYTSAQWDDYTEWYHQSPNHITKFSFGNHQFSTFNNNGTKIVDSALLLYATAYLTDPVQYQFQRGVNTYLNYRSLLTDNQVNSSSNNNVTTLQQ